MSNRNPKDQDEIYWRSRPLWEIEREQVRRFEVYFTKKTGHTIKWCPKCRQFTVEHTHESTH